MQYSFEQLDHNDIHDKRHCITVYTSARTLTHTGLWQCAAAQELQQELLDLSPRTIYLSTTKQERGMGLAGLTNGNCARVSRPSFPRASDAIHPVLRIGVRD